LPGPADAPVGSTTSLLNEAPRASDEDRVDWLSVAATLKSKNGLFFDWLAATDDA
jgi:hypothetical protein